jgi:hypothetical protein
VTIGKNNPREIHRFGKGAVAGLLEREPTMEGRTVGVRTRARLQQSEPVVQRPRKRERLLVSLCATTAFVLMLAVGSLVLPFLLRFVQESLWIEKLRSGDDRQKKEAAERLGKLQSVRAVPALIDLMRQDVKVYPGLSGARVLFTRDGMRIRRGDRAFTVPDGWCVPTK